MVKTKRYKSKKKILEIIQTRYNELESRNHEDDSLPDIAACTDGIKEDRQDKLFKFVDNYFDEIKERYPIEFDENQQCFFITRITGDIIKFFPKSNKIYSYKKKQWKKGGLGLIKKYFVDRISTV